MNLFKFPSIAVLTLTLYGCATTTGGIGKFGEDLDVKTCEGAGKEHEDKYTIVETSYTPSFQESTPIKHFSGIKNVKIESSKLLLSLIDKSLYEEYSTPLVTKLDEIHHDAHPLLAVVGGLFIPVVILPPFIIATPFLIWDKKWRSDFFREGWASWIYPFTFGCTEKKLLSPELDFTKKTKTGKSEWRDSPSPHTFLISGFDKDYERDVYLHSSQDVDIELSNNGILNTELTKNTTVKITCLDCDLLGLEEQNLYKDVKKTVELTADFREIKATLVAEEKTKEKLQAQLDKEAAIQRISRAKKDLQRRKETQGVPLSGFKAQCTKLGFKVGTTDFGNCVLELNDSK